MQHTLPFVAVLTVIVISIQGFETVKAMSLCGAHVIMACRDISKGNVAAEKIRDIRKTLIPKLTVLGLDLASLESVENFAEQFKAMKL